MGDCLVSGRRIVFYGSANNKMDLLHNKKEIVMEQYIPKSTLVAEIERRIKEIEEIGTYLSPKGILTNLLCYLDTLEVKDMDLEKELSLEDYESFFKKYPDLDNNWGFNECWVFAKYFYELGLQVSNKENNYDNI